MAMTFVESVRGMLELGNEARLAFIIREKEVSKSFRRPRTGFVFDD